MERQFIFVPRHGTQNYPLANVGHLKSMDCQQSSPVRPEVSIGKQPEITTENFLTLYCLQEDN